MLCLRLISFTDLYTIMYYLKVKYLFLSDFLLMYTTNNIVI